MKERERILDLVKQGIISTEEALTLLENSAKKEGEEAVKKDQSSAKKTIIPEEPKAHEPEFESAEFDSEESHAKGEERLKEEEQKDHDRLEAILEELANEASGYSVKLDEKNQEIKKVKAELKEAREQLMVLETMEDLDELSEEKQSDLEQLEESVDSLEDKLDHLHDEKEETEEKLRSVKKKQWVKQGKQFTEKFELPEDWKETATETFTQVGDKVAEAGNQFGHFMKETFSSVMENMDWKDVNVRVPGIASTKIDHEFYYADSSATIIDVKVANGNVVLKNWDSPDIKVEANIKIYGKVQTDKPLEAFMERSTIDVTDEKLLFHVPNKRIRTNLVFYLPERTYDHTALKLLNGNVNFEAFEGKDLYVKSTNGNIVFESLTATMLETEGVNGTVTVSDSTIRDLLVNTVNGDVVARGEFKGANLSTVNGTVKATLSGEDLKRLDATSVNGNVKVSFPKTLSVEGKAKSNLGTIQSRLEGIEIVKEKKDRTNQLLEFRRILGEDSFILDVGTTTGNILLKDNE